MRRKGVLSRAPRRSLLADRMTPILCRHHRDLKDACSAPTARRSVLRRPTPPRCNRSTVSTGRGASHSTTCIPGGITRGHRGDVLQTSRQWLRQDATEFRTQTNVHSAQRSARPSADKCSTFRINGRSADELRLAQVRMPTGAGAMMILQVHLPRDGPAHGRVGHLILRCVRQTPRVRWIAHRACSLGGRHISKRLRDSKQKSRFGQRGRQSLSWHGRRSFRTVTRKGMPIDARAQIAQNSWYGGWWTQGPAPSIR